MLHVEQGSGKLLWQGQPPIMDLTDHGVYGPACKVEIRPGRRCQVLHIPPPADSASPKMLFFCHGSMATMQQYGVYPT